MYCRGHAILFLTEDENHEIARLAPTLVKKKKNPKPSVSSGEATTQGGFVMPVSDGCEWTWNDDEDRFAAENSGLDERILELQNSARHGHLRQSQVAEAPHHGSTARPPQRDSHVTWSPKRVRIESPFSISGIVWLQT